MNLAVILSPPFVIEVNSVAQIQISCLAGTVGDDHNWEYPNAISQTLSYHRRRSRIGGVRIFRHRASSNLVGTLVGADSSACDFARTTRQHCFPARGVRMADRRNEPMELCPSCDRTGTANHDPLLCSSCCRFRAGHSVCAQLASSRIAIARLACFTRLLGGVRISDGNHVASQHMGQSRLHTNELSTGDPNRCGHRSLGNQFHHISVCGRRGGSVERRGRTMATSRGRCRGGVRRLRSVCFWQVAIAIKSSRSIGCGDTHRQGRADERLPRFRRAGIKVVGRVCCRNPPHYSSRNAGCCFTRKNRTYQRDCIGSSRFSLLFDCR